MWLSAYPKLIICHVFLLENCFHSKILNWRRIQQSGALTFDIWVPRLLCTPQHFKHIKTPIFADLQMKLQTDSLISKKLKDTGSELSKACMFIFNFLEIYVSEFQMSTNSFTKTLIFNLLSLHVKQACLKQHSLWLSALYKHWHKVHIHYQGINGENLRPFRIWSTTISTRAIIFLQQ